MSAFLRPRRGLDLSDRNGALVIHNVLCRQQNRSTWRCSSHRAQYQIFEGLFRAGIVIDILVFVSDVVLAWAFYEPFEHVDGALARLGVFLRIADAAVLASLTLSSC